MEETFYLIFRFEIRCAVLPPVVDEDVSQSGVNAIKFF